MRSNLPLSLYRCSTYEEFELFSMCVCVRVDFHIIIWCTCLFLILFGTAEKFQQSQTDKRQRKLATNETYSHTTSYSYRRHKITARILQTPIQPKFVQPFHKSVFIFICIHFRLIEIKGARNIAGVHHKILHKIHTVSYSRRLLHNNRPTNCRDRDREKMSKMFLEWCQPSSRWILCVFRVRSTVFATVCPEINLITLTQIKCYYVEIVNAHVAPPLIHPSLFVTFDYFASILHMIRMV